MELAGQTNLSGRCSTPCSAEVFLKVLPTPCSVCLHKGCCCIPVKLLPLMSLFRPAVLHMYHTGWLRPGMQKNTLRTPSDTGRPECPSPHQHGDVAVCLNRCWSFTPGVLPSRLCTAHNPSSCAQACARHRTSLNITLPLREPLLHMNSNTPCLQHPAVCCNSS